MSLFSDSFIIVPIISVSIILIVIMLEFYIKYIKPRKDITIVNNVSSPTPQPTPLNISNGIVIGPSAYYTTTLQGPVYIDVISIENDIITFNVDTESFTMNKNEFLKFYTKSENVVFPLSTIL